MVGSVEVQAARRMGGSGSEGMPRAGAALVRNLVCALG